MRFEGFEGVGTHEVHELRCCIAAERLKSDLHCSCGARKQQGKLATLISLSLSRAACIAPLTDSYGGVCPRTAMAHPPLEAQRIRSGEKSAYGKDDRPALTTARRIT
eukprot:3452391-Amphidinium_carterae.1